MAQATSTEEDTSSFAARSSLNSKIQVNKGGVFLLEVHVVEGFFWEVCPLSSVF